MEDNQHIDMAWQHSKSRQERGYGAAWVRLRHRIMARDKHLCQSCLASSRYVPATQVDHITPKAKGGTDDLTNLQSLCDACHRRKTAEDNGRSIRPETGIDGWPVA